MIATLFLAAGILFSWMVFKAYASGEITGRGWGFSTRTYCRDSDPVWYWVTFTCYVVCAVWATVFGIMAALSAATQAAG
jgi:hypothetical protein